MKPKHILLFALAAALAISPGAQARDVNRGKTAAALADHDFECKLDPAILKPWNALGIRLPAAVKAPFKLWKSVSALGELSSVAKDRCNKLPPQPAFIKGRGAGAMTRADLVVAQQDVTVYRAFSKAPFSCGFNPPAAELGSWWALTPPASDKAKYRRATAVCNSWNDFSMIVQCTLKKGSVVAIGATQSAACATKPAGCAAFPEGWKRSFPSSPEHQVFINTYRRTAAEIGEFLVSCHSAPYAGSEFPQHSPSR